MKKNNKLIAVITCAVTLAAGIIFVIYHYEKLLIALLSDGSGNDLEDID